MLHQWPYSDEDKGVEPYREILSANVFIPFADESVPITLLGKFRAKINTIGASRIY